MTDAGKAERLARVLWWAYWDGEPPYPFEDAPGQVIEWRNTATAALTWLDSLEDDHA